VQFELLIACLLPLGLVGYLFYVMKQTASQDDAVVAGVLVSEMVSEHPRLLGPPTKVLQLPKAESSDTTHKGRRRS